MSVLRIVVADESAAVRTVLRDVLQAGGEIRVVAEASDAAETLRVVTAQRPDIAAIGVPMRDGKFEVVSRIMAACPTPILAFCVRRGSGDDGAAFEVIRRGALDLIEKGAFMRNPTEGAALRAHVRRLARVAVVRHPASSSSAPARPLAPDAARPLAANVRRMIVGIAASAGGPAAVAAVLDTLPIDFPAPIAVVQHLPPGFANAFAQFLQAATRLPVQVVDVRTETAPGRVYVAPDARHLVAPTRGILSPSDAEPVDGHRPAATILFRSIAETFGGASIGVVLTGIGRDGAPGLREMCARGALTIAQDEASAPVWGMPGAAVSEGAVTRVLPVSEIGAALCEAVGQAGTARRKD